jgi:ubiquinone/menaquinone biosynthesis C-methylase UbiE
LAEEGSQGSLVGGEVYSVGYGAQIQEWHAQRTAENRAGFLLPHLRPGMGLLDCGCGPGTITLGLAEAVAPGLAVGIDMEPRQSARARALALERGVGNARFLTANLYALPFSDAAFDVVWAHNVLEHLRDPLRALQEMRRILKSGGMVAIRDPDLGTTFAEPPSPLVNEASALLLRVREHNGGSPLYARRQRRLLLDAGFARTEAFAYAEYQGNAQSLRAFARVLVEVLRGEEATAVAIGQGWAARATLDGMSAAILAWSERPDALRVVVDCAALGYTE